jgi:hypothetical protein
MEDRSREVITESKKLELITKEISGGMRKVADETEQINQAVKRVDDISAITRNR